MNRNANVKTRRNATGKNLRSKKLHPFLRRRKKLAVVVMILRVLHSGNNGIRPVQHSDVIGIRPVLHVVTGIRPVLHVVIGIRLVLHVVMKTITVIVNVAPVLKIEGEKYQTKDPGGPIKIGIEAPATDTIPTDETVPPEGVNQVDGMSRDTKEIGMKIHEGVRNTRRGNTQKGNITAKIVEMLTASNQEETTERIMALTEKITSTKKREFRVVALHPP